ncbi:DotI/IcmL/TraM family protein [Legionella fairfieldensis]|uniref:DotI/IcmL/TraM family protein n=1 Tax=Legionella fairfieldensis TaxID=45064 RepID=UPI000688894B|nr:DotI/IcmL/TraM family protein [Legionella fairfieldensis]
MKKSMLWVGLMTILGASVHAENNNNTHAKQTQAMPVSTATADSIQTPSGQGIQVPATPGTPTPASPGNQTPSTPDNPTPAASSSSAPTTGASTPLPQPLNCNYHIPAQTTHIEQAIVLKWAEKAAEQSFEFDHNLLDKQLSALKACYTEQGWQGFNDALEKSGNLNAIKSQQLIVSSMVSGQGKITEGKDNQWKATIPMQVVYQNDKEKLTQSLNINLVVGRKVSGDLGIMQMIAVPVQVNPLPQSTTNQPATTTTTPATPLQHPSP